MVLHVPNINAIKGKISFQVRQRTKVFYCYTLRVQARSFTIRYIGCFVDLSPIPWGKGFKENMGIMMHRSLSIQSSCTCCEPFPAVTFPRHHMIHANIPKTILQAKR
jgi:hypothetical protein